MTAGSDHRLGSHFKADITLEHGSTVATLCSFIPRDTHKGTIGNHFVLLHGIMDRRFRFQWLRCNVILQARGLGAERWKV
uniref:Uncharacterized protein n=1 Tax=Arundo donax TaxID=35708 RepID=A0A0A9EYF4_ARUDO